MPIQNPNPTSPKPQPAPVPAPKAPAPGVGGEVVNLDMDAELGQPVAPTKPKPIAPAPLPPIKPAVPAVPTPIAKPLTKKTTPTPQQPAQQFGVQPTAQKPASSTSIKPPTSIKQPKPTPVSVAPIQDTSSVPELAKKKIIKEAVDKDSGNKETIYTMPEKFRKVKKGLSFGKKGKNSKLILIIGIILAIVAIGLAGTAFYIWAGKYYQQRTSVPSSPKINPVKPPVKEPEQSLSQSVSAEIKDINDLVLVSLKLDFPADALMDKELQLSLTGEENTEEFPNYLVIGGIFELLPSGLMINQPIQAKLEYDQELTEDTWKKDITLGYFKDGLWTPLDSVINIETNQITAELSLIPSQSLALIIDKSKTVPSIEDFQIAPHISSSQDTDSDGLTDIEEGIYQTLVNNPDSDMGGDADGQEVLNLMDPTKSGEAKLAAAGLVNIYTNQTYSYTFFYPSSWLSRAIPETDNQEILVITNTGEFFSITVQENLDKLTPKQWYLNQSPQVDPNTLIETTVNNEPAVWSPDHLTIYIAKDNQIYLFSYNIGTEKQANFKASFQMMINSFQFIVQYTGRPDNTLIKYPDLPGVYLIQDGKKRSFQSGEIFETLGFLWEDVIEIPVDEIYPDGEIINSRLDGTLIKYPDSAGIYLIQNGKKRAFQSGEVFEQLGYLWDNVIEIPIDETYPDGEIITGTE